MDLFYKGKPYKENLSVREISYELNIAKSTLSRYLKATPTPKNSFFEQDGEVVNQYFWGKLINSFENIQLMGEKLNLSKRNCLKRLSKKELWFHKYFEVIQ